MKSFSLLQVRRTGLGVQIAIVALSIFALDWASKNSNLFWNNAWPGSKIVFLVKTVIGRSSRDITVVLSANLGHPYISRISDEVDKETDTRGRVGLLSEDSG